ncbi:MAG: abortive infection family protein [Chthonomonadales bacterium]|nr:abortive infection family protein [Chthonomonadales bacterium]
MKLAVTIEDLLKAANDIHETMEAKATGQPCDSDRYEELRQLLLSDPRSREHAPQVLWDYRSLGSFWMYIKYVSATYPGRRKHLEEVFRPLFKALEVISWSAMSDASISDVLKRLGYQAVQEAWAKALDRRRRDPDGAITSARAVLEATCKQILEECSVEYDRTLDLPRLYKQAAKVLNLGADTCSEGAFKQALGGCVSVVCGLAAIRNELGDAHGKGQDGRLPMPFEAELAVNLAGAMASFLFQTLEHQQR